MWTQHSFSPALGINVEEHALKAIQLFRLFEIHYLEVGLLEALWKILKLVPLDKLSRVEIGIRAVRRTYHLLTPSPHAYVKAVEIYHRGHRDYIDALYYAAAATENIPLLTIDESFIKFLDEHGYIVKGLIYTPSDLQQLSSNHNYIANGQ